MSGVEHFAYIEYEAHNYIGRELCHCGAAEDHWLART